jgi:hypothetical protein
MESLIESLKGVLISVDERFDRDEAFSPLPPLLRSSLATPSDELGELLLLGRGRPGFLLVVSSSEELEPASTSALLVNTLSSVRTRTVRTLGNHPCEPVGKWLP